METGQKEQFVILEVRAGSQWLKVAKENRNYQKGAKRQKKKILIRRAQ